MSNIISLDDERRRRGLMGRGEGKPYKTPVPRSTVEIKIDQLLAKMQELHGRVEAHSIALEEVVNILKKNGLL